MAVDRSEDPRHGASHRQNGCRAPCPPRADPAGSCPPADDEWHGSSLLLLPEQLSIWTEMLKQPRVSTDSTLSPVTLARVAHRCQVHRAMGNVLPLVGLWACPPHPLRQIAGAGRRDHHRQDHTGCGCHTAADPAHSDPDLVRLLALSGGVLSQHVSSRLGKGWSSQREALSCEDVFG